MRLNNPDLNPIKLIELSVKKIANYNDSKSYKSKFIDFIRNYANSLDQIKNDFLNDANIDNKKMYNIVFNENDQHKLSKKLVNDFNEHIKIISANNKLLS